MKQILKTSITISGSLLLSFLIIFVFVTFFNEPVTSSLSIENEFYSQNLEPNKKKIFFVGSSFGARINGTLINQELVANNITGYNFYNLGKSGDRPQERLANLEKTLETKPDFVILDYSIALFGYKTPKIDPTNYKIHQTIGKYFDYTDLSKLFNNFPNPKLVSLTTLLKFINDDDEKLFPKYTDKPFYKAQPNADKILTKEKLEKLALEHEFVDDSINSHNLDDFKELIEKMHKENINVIIFVPPHSYELLNIIPEEKKQNFLSTLNFFGQENSVPIYNLLEKYKNKTIWSDLYHVAINPNAEEYSKDISKIIIKEIRE